MRMTDKTFHTKNMFELLSESYSDKEYVEKLRNKEAEKSKKKEPKNPRRIVTTSCGLDVFIYDHTNS